MQSFTSLLSEIRGCRLCARSLAVEPRPVLQVLPSARLLIAAQAPGRKVYESGVPFDDLSGERLREWTGLSRETFYDPRRIAILPMGFCYPGSGKHGDLPPRPECAPAWRAPLMQYLKHIRLTLAVGRYAQIYHLAAQSRSLTETVADWRNYLPMLLPLPHPSPRNNGWLRRNPWFETELVPRLRDRVASALEH
jgi:uracil-DNA glycosylase